jgi:predicted transcriptional regulator
MKQASRVVRIHVPLGTLVTPRTPSTVLPLLARTRPRISTSSIGTNSATTTLRLALLSDASGWRKMSAWVSVRRKKARGEGRRYSVAGMSD